MEIGISLFDEPEFEYRVRLLKENGVNRAFTNSETNNFHQCMSILDKNGIICDSLHAPFSRINDMWQDDDDAANAMLHRLKDSVNKCVQYGIPVSVVHLSSGKPMPEINQKGIRRFESLFDHAIKNNVIIALENQRFLENISFFMDRYHFLGFCWDCGHEYCFTKGIRFMELYGKRVKALHIHDNRCGEDTDDHYLPFDGNIDFEVIAKSLAEIGFGGTLMLEVFKNPSLYGNMSDKEYFERAASSARRLAEMIRRY